MIAAGIAAALVIGVVSVGVPGGSRFSFEGTFARAESSVATAVSSGLERLGVSQPASAAPGEALEAPAKEQSAAVSPPKARTAKPARSIHLATPNLNKKDGSHADAPAASPILKSPLEAAVGVGPVTGLPEPLPASREIVIPTAVYSPADTAVEPPRLIRPQMPKEPAPGQDTGYFDIVVNEGGTVEQVKLISPRKRYHDRMLVAAAKAWKFRPATLNGYAVKYRIRIPIILSGMP
jgi:TonB family protein